jgi:hypothetical protein
VVWTADRDDGVWCLVSGVWCGSIPSDVLVLGYRSHSSAQPRAVYVAGGVVVVVRRVAGGYGSWLRQAVAVTMNDEVISSPPSSSSMSMF